MDMTSGYMKRGILLFWAVWLGIIAASNLTGLLKALRLVDVRFASNNFELVRGISATYGTPAGVAGLLFVGIILWQFVAAYRFLTAWGSVDRIHAAFGVSLALWAGFLIAGEFFVHYEYEGIHMRIFTAQLASLLTIRLLPD